MSKGTIVLVPFPFTDLSGNKVRPCLVLYEQPSGDDCIVSFISSVKPKRLSTFDVKIDATPANGLKVDSIIKTDKIATLQKKIILGELGKPDARVLKEINVRLKKLFTL